jgi:cytidine deaminase
MNEPLGILTRFDELTPTEQEVVDLACFGADSSADHKLCFNSDFPVGAGILAANDLGETKLFAGANVENRWFPPTICAERTAATRAAFEGFKQFRIVSVFCRKHPGGSPCGLCRQVLAQFGRDSFLLNIVDRERTVRKALVGDLLPAAGGASVSFAQLSDDEKKLVKRVSAMKKCLTRNARGQRSSSVKMQRAESGSSKASLTTTPLTAVQHSLILSRCAQPALPGSTATSASSSRSTTQVPSIRSKANACKCCANSAQTLPSCWLDRTTRWCALPSKSCCRTRSDRKPCNRFSSN